MSEEDNVMNGSVGIGSSGVFSDIYGGEDDDEDFQKNKYLVFLAGEKKYGIKIDKITEIVEIQKITEVPNMPDYVKGVINLRGKIIPVIDFRCRIGIEAVEYGDRTCIIILDIDSIVVGLIVDSVSEVLSIDDTDMSDPPEFRNTANHSQNFVSKIGRTEGSVVVILDLDKLVRDDSFKRKKKVKEA